MSEIDVKRMKGWREGGREREPSEILSSAVRSMSVATDTGRHKWRIGREHTGAVEL